MADDNESNFGNADGGGVPDVGNDGANPGDVAGNGIADPASFAPKRGRGRPRKSDDGNASSTGSPGQQGRKEKSQASKKLDLTLFASQIQGAHAMLAMLTKNPLWNIDEQSANSLAQALLDVMSHHSIDINPATVAYLKLVGICAAIYGPKLLTMKMQNDIKKSEENRTVDMQ